MKSLRLLELVNSGVDNNYAFMHMLRLEARTIDRLVEDLIEWGVISEESDGCKILTPKGKNILLYNNQEQDKDDTPFIYIKPGK